MLVNCGRCGRPYHPTSAEWGDLCGQCLAVQIEDLLAERVFLLGERRPPVRASAGPMRPSDRAAQDLRPAALRRA